MTTLHFFKNGKLAKILLGSLAIIMTLSHVTHARAVLDFDGDNKTDYAIARPSGGSLTWYILRANNTYTGTQWGAYPGNLNNDRVVPADYDGDNKWDIAVWRPGTQANFYILRSSNNTLQTVPWGSTGDNPNMTQDFDGDNKADPTVVRDIDGYLYWFTLQSTNNQLHTTVFGVDFLDVPVRGNYDGDTKADVAVYRGGQPHPASTFYVLKSSNGALIAQQFGDATQDVVVPSDYDGDGKTDFAINRNGAWYWLQSSNGQVRGIQFGTATTDSAAQGDYDGDGKTDVAVRRDVGPAAGDFYVQGTTAGFSYKHWGNGLNDLLVGGLIQNVYNPY